VLSLDGNVDHPPRRRIAVSTPMALPPAVAFAASYGAPPPDPVPDRPMTGPGPLHSGDREV
jgi:hypothetical protein